MTLFCLGYSRILPFLVTLLCLGFTIKSSSKMLALAELDVDVIGKSTISQRTIIKLTFYVGRMLENEEETAVIVEELKSNINQRLLELNRLQESENGDVVRV